MIKRKKYKRGGVSTEGYKKNSPDKDNSFNLIPSNSITMKDVNENIIGIGLGENGEMSSMKFMKPDEEHNFKKAHSVFEIPQYQIGVNYGQEDYLNDLTNTMSQSQQVATQPVTEAMTTPATNTYQKPQDLNSIFEVNDNAYSQSTYNTTGGNIVNTELQTGVDKMSATAQNRANQELQKQGLNQSNIKNPEKEQIFNPYGGVDIPTAASILGESIEKGDTFGTLASGVKLAAGLGRNFFGGMGQARRNQFVTDEYNERQRDGLTQATYQEGGEMLDEFDVKSINNSIGGVDFTSETINSLFERVSSAQKPDTYKPQMGRYGEFNYFDVDRVEGDEVYLNTTSKNPYGRDSYKNLLPYLQEQNPGKNVNLNYVPKSMELGGELTQEELLSGQYSGENSMETNAEIEKGEHLKDSQGNVSEVKGETHENGGVNVKLEKGEKILSDHTKIGATTAKMFRDDFELEVQAKDTYATIVDKFTKKSGLKKIYEEQEELMTKVNKETQKEDSTTKDINLQFLSKKINELEEKKKPLEEAKKMLFDKAFDLQEQAKPKEDMEQEMFQIGGQMYNSDQVIGYANNYGIEPEKALELIKKFQGGGAFGNKGEAKAIPEGQSLNPETGLYGEITQQQLSETALRNPWFDWSNFDPKSKEDVLRFQSEFSKRSTEGNTLEEDGKFGRSTNTAQLPLSTVILPPVSGDGSIIKGGLPMRQYVEQLKQKVSRGEQLNEEEIKDYERLNIALLPDQSPIQPTALQPVLKAERRYGRIDPMMIDPTQAISQINSAQMSAQNSLNERPDASRSATLAQIAANSQENVNKAISQTNQLNQRAQQQADAFNIRQGDNEVNANAQDALSYEQRMLQGMSNTENDFQDYFQTMQNTNMTNFKTIEQLNLMNALNDKFQYDGTQFKQIGVGDTVEEQLGRVKFAQATQNKMNALNDKFQYDGTQFKQIGVGMTQEEMQQRLKFAQATQGKMKWGGKKR